MATKPEITMEGEAPRWYLGRGMIDEIGFCREYLRDRELVCVDGEFFDCNGRITDETILKKEIYQRLEPCSISGIARRIGSILDLLRIEAHRETQDNHEDCIHLANGTLFLDLGFTSSKCICRHRLPVRYNPDAPEPKRWLQFLQELLEEEDIETLQQYMGYCLVPTTRAQKMLLIIGNGGEGKSRIGVVLKALLGSSMNLGSIAKVETNPFARADLEHLLALVDDDLKMEALHQTNYLKSIISAELPMDLERKGIQSYQGKLNVRFLAFGNGNLRALHDRSYGFFRRQIILSAKKRDPKRVDDPYLAEKLLEEIEGIFQWALGGLLYLKGNNYVFTLSDRTRRNMDEAMAEGNNILGFLNSQGYFTFDKDGRTTSRALYAVYKDWCTDNSFDPLTSKTFLSYLKSQAGELGIRSSASIPIGNGKYARGFQGIRLFSRF